MEVKKTSTPPKAPPHDPPKKGSSPPPLLYILREVIIDLQEKELGLQASTTNVEGDVAKGASDNVTAQNAVLKKLSDEIATAAKGKNKHHEVETAQAAYSTQQTVSANSNRNYTTAVDAVNTSATSLTSTEAQVLACAQFVMDNLNALNRMIGA